MTRPQRRDLYLMALTHNIMIIFCVHLGFLRSRPVPFTPGELTTRGEELNRRLVFEKKWKGFFVVLHLKGLFV